MKDKRESLIWRLQNALSIRWTALFIVGNTYLWGSNPRDSRQQSLRNDLNLPP